jgi:hypothetical protein
LLAVAILAVALVVGPAGPGGFGPLRGVPGPVAALAAQLDQPGNVVYLASVGQTPPGIDQTWTAVAATGTVTGASRYRANATDGNIYDIQNEVRGDQMRTLSYDSRDNTLTVSGWYRHRPSSPPTDAVAGSFDQLGAYVTQLPKLLRAGKAHVVGGKQQAYGHVAYKIATSIGGFVIFVAADVKHPRLLGTGAYECPRPHNKQPGPDSRLPSASSCPLSARTAVHPVTKLTEFEITRNPSALDVRAAHPHARVIQIPAPTCRAKPKSIVGLLCLAQ